MSGHSHGRHHRPEDHDAADFDALYASGVQWSGNPNDALLHVVSDLHPVGEALELGCGEGADVVWLAQQGWRVVGVDPAAAAIERTQALVDASEVAESVELLTGDVSAVAGRTFDLVTCFYVPFAPEDTEIVAQLEKLVAPGGHLLFVHHDFPDGRVLDPNGVAKQLGELKVVTLENSERHVTAGAGAHHRLDVVLLAQRPA